ncbi:ABC transporter permease [Nocardiopsis sp. CNT-189]|uniref:ABC transporter permease n=1 Tax=Nocardiopsis oceanisediminis TaxID=2816862 RepID=UPI003B29B251
MTPGAPPRPARLSPRDVLGTAAAGLRARPLRVLLSALGIAIGIAAMVAVVGISASGRAGLEERLESLGTNLVTAEPGKSLFGGEAELPAEAAGRAGRIPGVQRVGQAGEVPGASVYRSDLIPEEESGGLSVQAAGPGLPGVLRAEMAEGSWLTAPASRYPAVVLGATAAERLGITRVAPDTRVLIGDAYFSVVGVLEPVELAPELDTAALVGWDAAVRELGFSGNPTRVYVRADPERLGAVRELLPGTVDPERPHGVSVSRPSDALAAQQEADRALTGLLLGLGGVALLVGGVGVANTMVISVLERRGEIGLRRALGATRRQIRGQFLAEAVALSALGGAAGAVLGAGVTAGYALFQGWAIAVPPWALLGGVAATVPIGALAGLLPAVRAARLPPTEALGPG